MDIDDNAMAIADAMGPSFTELAPPGEDRFEPVSMALIVSYWILHAVAAGIHDGIQEKAKEGTVAMLEAVGRAIGARLLPERIRRLFDKEAPASVADSRQQAADQLGEAQKAVARLDGLAAAELTRTVASTVTHALSEAGLNRAAAGQVGQTIDVQIRVIVGGTPLA